jgi:hypothetical protein
LKNKSQKKLITLLSFLHQSYIYFARANKILFENNLSISIDVTDLELLDFSNPLINRQYRKLNALAEKQEKVIENAYKKIYENVQ